MTLLSASHCRVLSTARRLFSTLPQDDYSLHKTRHKGLTCKRLEDSVALLTCGIVVLYPIHNQHWHFFVIWPFQLLLSDWIHLNDSVGDIVVVKESCQPRKQRRNFRRKYNSINRPSDSIQLVPCLVHPTVSSRFAVLCSSFVSHMMDKMTRKHSKTTSLPPIDERNDSTKLRQAFPEQYSPSSIYLQFHYILFLWIFLRLKWKSKNSEVFEDFLIKLFN